MRYQRTRNSAAAQEHPRRGRRWLVIGLSALVVVGGCDLGVTNPGTISDDALESLEAMTPLVVGMAGDFATNFDEIAYFMGIASNDITHSGAFEAEEFMQRGEIEPRHVNGLWGESHRARWVAEQGIPRLQSVLGSDYATSPLAVEAHLWAGFSNRVLGENMCVAIFDAGPPTDNMDHFTRAEGWFAEAISLATAQGEADMLEAAYAGRAQVRAALGNWAGASADAGQVADDMIFEALYDAASNRENNWLFNQSHNRDYFSAVNTLAERLNNTDPRMPWTDRSRNGADGVTAMLRQDKYLSLGAAIPLAQGDEMRLIEAEAELELNGAAGVGPAMVLINDVRVAAGVATKSASTVAEAMVVLREERDIIFWMEGRHLWELRRFNDAFLNGRDSCIPPSENEALTNPNL